MDQFRSSSCVNEMKFSVMRNRNGSNCIMWCYPTLIQKRDEVTPNYGLFRNNMGLKFWSSGKYRWGFGKCLGNKHWLYTPQ